MKAAYLGLLLLFFSNEGFAQPKNCPEKTRANLLVSGRPVITERCLENLCDKNSPEWVPPSEGAECPSWCAKWDGNEEGEGAGCYAKYVCQLFINALKDTRRRPDMNQPCLENPCDPDNFRTIEDAENCPRWCVRRGSKCWAKDLLVRETYDPNEEVEKARMNSVEERRKVLAEIAMAASGSENTDSNSARLFGLGSSGGNIPPPGIPPNLFPPGFPGTGGGFPGSGGFPGGVPPGFPGTGSGFPGTGSGFPGTGSGFPGGFPPILPPSGGSGGFGGCFRLSYPENCANVNIFQTNSFAQAIEPPVNIPYCQRIPCSSGNPRLEEDAVSCQANPGCYFDQSLHFIRQWRAGFMLGIPVCHLAIRNTNFHRLANSYINGPPTKVWDPVYARCFLEQNDDAIKVVHPGCHTLGYFQLIGGYPKITGWEGITEYECTMINGCWIPSASGYKCYHPSNTGEVRIRSGSDPRHGYSSFNPSSSDIYGQPICRQFNPSTPQDYLSSYYECRQAGCVVDPSITSENIKDQFLEITLSELVPDALKPYFWGLVTNQQIRPDNWREELQKLISQFQSNQFGQFGSQGGFPQINNLLHQLAQIAPLRLNIQESARNFNLLPTQGNVPCEQLLSNLHPSLREAFPFICPQARPTPQCPYDFGSMFPSGGGFLPQLTGSVTGCCERHLCYTPRSQMTRQRSGSAEFEYFFGEFGECSKSCGGGTQSRRRPCIKPDNCFERGGYESGDEDSCQGVDGVMVQTRNCNTMDCPYWDNWGAFGPCSEACGPGTRERTRNCVNANTDLPHGGCIPDGMGSSQTEDCVIRPNCPEYGPIGEFTTCPCKPASGAKTYRYRTMGCINHCDGDVEQQTQEREECINYCANEDCQKRKVILPCLSSGFLCYRVEACGCTNDEHACVETDPRRNRSYNRILCHQGCTTG